MLNNFRTNDPALLIVYMFCALILILHKPGYPTTKYMVYCRSGNYHVKKLSYDKFSCKIFFIGTTPDRVSVNSVH